MPMQDMPRAYAPHTNIAKELGTFMKENTRLSVAHLVRDPVLLFLVLLVFTGLILFILFPLYKIFAYRLSLIHI